MRGIEKDLLPAAQEYKLGLLPFFPLASGLLTGKYKRGSAAPDHTRFAKAPALRDRFATPRNEEMAEKLQAFAEQRGHTVLELAFSWLASHPQVSSVIAGATRPSRSSRTSRRSSGNCRLKSLRRSTRSRSEVVLLPLPVLHGERVGVRGYCADNAV